MVLDKLELNGKDCATIMSALEEYEDLCPVEKQDEVHELWLNVQSEAVRLGDIERRKANGLHAYVFHDADGNELGCEEFQTDGNAWEYIYKTFARYYPTGVTFEVFD